MAKLVKRNGPANLAWVLGLAVAATGLGCGGSDEKGDANNAKASASGKPAANKTAIQNCGSDTMVNVAQVWAQEHKKAAGGDVEVKGGGSGVGINQLMKGLIQVANASREMTQAEKDQAKKNTGKDVVEFTVGYDGIGIYVHKDNPVVELTVDDLAGIYGDKGGTEKWSQLKVDLPAADQIVVVSRQSSSGTYAYFREHILKNKDYRLGMQEMGGSKDVVDLVGKTPGAIGYSGMGYKTDAVKFVNLAAKKGEKAYAPTIENVRDKTYPLARALYIYTLGQPEGDVKKYIDWILSPAGQEILKREGYIRVEDVKGASR